MSSPRHQQRFTLDVRGGIFKDTLLGPVYWPGRLNRQTYLESLLNTLSDILDYVYGSATSNVVHARWGTSTFFNKVRRHLDYQCGQEWMGRGGPVSWPPQSPDLNTLDFYLWGHLKSVVYSISVNTEEELSNK